MNNPLREFKDRHKEVYPPSEDSWFLAEHLFQFLLNDPYYESQLKERSVILCEVGIGSGYISHFLISRIPTLQIIGTDISSLAITIAKYTLRKMIKTKIPLICTNLLNCLNPKKFYPDLIIFNPPYVKTPLSEFLREDSPLVKSWSGGPNGIQVLTEFLQELTRFKFNDCFFLSSSLN
ncbi:MAG: methyltransferase, partial [Candidatus Hodarchaeales archaeon]